jgi:hypothetical protein
LFLLLYLSFSSSDITLVAIAHKKLSKEIAFSLLKTKSSLYVCSPGTANDKGDFDIWAGPYIGILLL